MELIEKDFIVGGHKLGTYYSYEDIDPELIPTAKGEKVIPAPYIFERDGGNFTLIKRHEPGSKLGWPAGGYEVNEGACSKRFFDLNQVICAPTTPYQQMLIDKMKVKVLKSAQTDEVFDSSVIEIVDREEVLFKEPKIEDYLPKTPGKRGRKPLSEEEKAKREAEKMERAQRSGGKRGRPAGTGKPKEEKPVDTEPKAPGRRGRPALSEEEKAKREAEKAKRAAISGGKRGRPRKNP